MAGTIAITWSVVILIIGALLSIGAIAFGKKPSQRKMFGWIGGVIVGLMIVAIIASSALPAGLDFLNKTPFTKSYTLPGGTVITYSTVNQPQNVVSGAGASGCAYQPTGSYTTKDKFSTDTIAGTSYYKPNGQPATTTATTNLNKGTEYTYWVSNATTFVKPVGLVADCSVNVYTADAWKNASATITGYDTVNRQSVSDGAYNTSVGANGQANIEVTYQGTAKQSAMPFGGLMVVEYNSTYSDVICTGSVLRAGNPSNFHLTYTTQFTTHTYKAFEFGPELDDGSGSSRVISCQLKNGATDAGTSQVYYRFIGANYYVTNDGNIVLDTEKNANQDTARTAFGTRTLTTYTS